ncbi:MAG: hypothetical protein ISR82_06815 [Candidatus Marinimicrobia bacterium]|nr:hypothetical protein [Candidatus Neomarinimicrobiota bacterium]MBL7010916.1 hypothetical protein [Candidatus Neomarinimicrobiota bacterium]MBL7031352.1 hypothetical protein [Candidatus Neomarinimicrobiota bacterium]
MKKIIIISTLSVLFGLTACQSKKGSNKVQRTNTESVLKIDNERLIYYTCPMESHKHIHSGEAGKCPECGMKLVAAVVTSEDQMEYYGCPMASHSHVRSDEPGTCDECKMKLKPMRLKKS